MSGERRELQIQLGPRRARRVADADLGFGQLFTHHMLVMDHEASKGWQRPRIVPFGPLSLDPSASVFHYGQAMFDGLKAFRWRDGSVHLFRSDRHCRRMADAAPRLCMPAPDPALLQRALKALIQIDRDWVPSSVGSALYIRPVLIGSGAGLGVRPSDRYTLYVILSPVGPYYPEGFKPVRIWVEERYVRAAPGGTGAVKAGGNYGASLVAAEEARRRGYAQVLWLDAHKRRALEEVGVMNLFVRIGDELATPPLEGTILAGVTRDSVLTLLSDWGVPARERAITIDELLEADRAGTLREVFGCGTAAVITPISELGMSAGNLKVGGGQVGEMAQRLYDTITGIQYGLREDQHHWMQPVD